MIKKIIILIFSIFILTGCYDNIELNKLAMISGVGIDYLDDEFFVTYEILNDTKTLENTTMKSYTITGSGKSISEAFVDASYRTPKKPFFDHLKVVLISNNVINEHIDEITDYLIRDINIRDEFFLLVANNTTPKEILNHVNDNSPVVSDLIVSLIDNEAYNNNLATKEYFHNTLAKFISDNIDVVLSSVSILDDEISLDKFYIFDGYEFKNTLSIHNSALYSLVTKNVFSLIFSKEYDNKNLTISITNAIPSIDVTSDKITINLDLIGKILENNPNFDLKEEKTYQMLNKDFSNLIKKDVTNFVKILQNNKSDILGLEEIYHRKTRKDNANLWETADVLVNVNLKINTKGFIFEVKK